MGFRSITIMKTELFDEAREGNPVEDLVPLILDAKRFDVEISPVEGDRTCKIKIGLLDILLSIDDLVEIVQALPDAILLGK